MFQEWIILRETKYCLFSECAVTHRCHSNECPHPHSLLLKASITCATKSSTFFLIADLPPLSPACCWFCGHSAVQWWSALHLLKGNFCSARSASLFADLPELSSVGFDFFFSLSPTMNADLWHPRSRVQTRPKPLDFYGRKNHQHAFLRRGSKRICPMSQLCGLSKTLVV
jgi:hypothetical protein